MLPTIENGHRRQRSSRSSLAPPSRLDGIRISVHHLFSGRSRVGPPESRTPETPKPLRLALGNFSSTRLAIPYLTRSNTIPPPSPTTHDPLTRVSPRLITARSLRRQLTTQRPREAPISSAPHSRQNSHSGRRFVGVDPAEIHLAELAEIGRRRSRENRSRRKARRCAPKIKNKKIRSKILSCFISGLFLVLILTVYLAIALSNTEESQEFHVLLILIILVITIVFCHSLIRLCMMLIHPPSENSEARDLPSMIGPGGFANPRSPIRVALARDEEAAGIENVATKMPPPAYGLWRESVRVDPNRIYWQRNEAALLERQNSTQRNEGRPTTANRPPSYISDDGVDYVVEAEPRSIAPTVDVPLPEHPSERRRLAY